MRVLFLKAAIRGGASADLFSVPVTVEGHMTKEGTFVAAYQSHRQKKREAPAQADLWLGHHEPPAAPKAAPAESPNPLARFGAKVEPNGDVTLTDKPNPAREQLNDLRVRIAGVAEHLGKRWHSAISAAKDAAKAKEPGRGKWFGRNAQSWTVRQEGWFQEALRAKLKAEEPSLRALLAKFDRLSAEADRQAERLGVNEPWRADSVGVIGELRNLLDHGQGPVRHGSPQSMVDAAAPPKEEPAAAPAATEQPEVDAADLQALYGNRRAARLKWEELRDALMVHGGKVANRDPKVIEAKGVLDAINDKVADAEIAANLRKPTTARSIRALYGIPERGRVFHYVVSETYQAGPERPRDIFVCTPHSKDETKPSSLPPDTKISITFDGNAPHFQVWDWRHRTAAYGEGWAKARSKPKSLEEIKEYLKAQDDKMWEWTHGGAAAANAEHDAERAAEASGWPAGLKLVEHLTRSGKTIKGVVRTDLNYVQAKAIDEYTFKKTADDGAERPTNGWFIREKHVPAGVLGQVEPAAAPTQSDVARNHNVSVESAPGNNRFIVRGEGGPLADFRIGANRKVVGLRYFHENQESKGLVDEAVASFVAGDGPKEGDTKVENGVTYTLRGSRWHAPEASEAGGYTAWVLDPAGRDALLERFQPTHERVIAHHVTRTFPAARGTPLPPPATNAEVVGVADHDGVQALVVSVNGTTKRPDGGTYHLTWSMEPGHNAVEGNDAVAAGWTPVDPPVSFAASPEWLARESEAPAERPAALPTEAPTDPPKHRFASMDELIAHNRSTRAEADALAAAGKPVRMTNKDGRVALVGPDMSKPGAWRMTRLDADGPTGHTEHADAQEAFREAFQQAFRPVAAPEAPAARPSAESAPAPTLQWGVPAGTGKAERRNANAVAMAILNRLPAGDPMDAKVTAEDRQALARYSGTGGIGDSLNEFYTDPAVASAMWRMLENCGFTGGEVLEPSSGTGVFLHTAPRNANMTAVELDGIAARIAGILHRPAEVNEASLERFATQDGRQFDAVIGNVPFGLRGGTIAIDKPDLATAEGYFVDTALDKAKAGGLVALIVPTGFVDSARGRAVRERVLCKGEFLGAHRLPNTAFEAAHTEVTSDIVVFRKRPQDIAGALGSLEQDHLKALGVWDADFLSGQYFTEGRGRANIMGTLEEGWRAKAGIGNDITVTGSMSGIPEALASWHPVEREGAKPSPSMREILDVLDGDPDAQKRAVSAALRPPYQVAKVGDVKVVDGVRYILQGEPPRWHRAEEDTPAAVLDAVRVAELLDAVAGKGGDRAALIAALDAWVAAHGAPARNRDLAAWLSAPTLSLPEGMSLEDHARNVADIRRRVARLLGAVREDGTYSDLVTGREVEREATGVDMVAAKLAADQGAFTSEQLSEATGRDSRDDVLDHLFASPAYAVDPDGQTWTTLDSYLAGDLWAKLDACRAAADHEGLAPEHRAKYAKQALALEEAISPQSLEDVETMINSGFVTPEDISAWFNAQRAEQLASHKYTYGSPADVDITYADGIYTIKRRKTEGSDRDWMPHDADLVERYLNRQAVKKDEREKLERLNQEFRAWLLTSDRRDAVEDRYNRAYRGFRPRVYSDAPIAIPGLNPALRVNAFHYSGLRWALEAGKGIIAADVGLGKTGRALMLAKIAKVTGQAKKPTIVVPKSVLANWLAEAEFWFPGSRVLVIGETYSKDKDGRLISRPDDEATRRRKYHDMQQNDYDFILISQPAWNDLDLDPVTKESYARDEFWNKRGEAMGLAGDKRRNQIRTAAEQAEAQRQFKKHEDTIHANDLGIDCLIMDEGHAYKNLYAVKNRFGESPKFLGGGGLSNRALDTFYKTRSIRDANGGRGVYMLTATPTKNSPLEVYSMLSHIAPEAFERMGIKNSEDFLDRFVEFETDNVLGVDGSMEEQLVTAGFKNMGELREVMKRYIDRKTAADVGLRLPARDDRQHAVDMTAEQEAIYVGLREDAAGCHGKQGDAEGESHIFSIMDKMQKAALDLDLLLGPAGGVPRRSPKVEAAVTNIVQGIVDGGQVVFCEPIAMHEKIAKALVTAGMKRSEIGICNAQDAPSSAARQRLSDDFNAGKLKVVIGNSTMSEGMNLQKATTDIHHLDLPWEPGSMQQRNGRGLRQGNKKASVRIHTYLAKGSFDGYRFQTLAAKRDWQDLLWNGGDRVENLARRSGPSRTETLIMLSADPEAARAQYETSKSAAEQRQTAAERGKVIDMFGRFREMHASLGKLKAKGHKENSPAVIRLEQKANSLRERLEDSKWFTHKALLDAPETEAIIEPVTNTAYRAGSAFTVHPGPESPLTLKADAGPTKWVVSSVDPATGIADCRPYADGGYRSVTIKVADLKSGVTPFDYSRDAEVAEIKAAAETRKAEAAAALKASKDAREARTTKEAVEAEHLTMKHVLAMPEHVREAIGAEAIQRRLKDTQRGHHGDYDQKLMVGPNGEVELVPSYNVAGMVDTHDFLLPGQVDKERAIDAYVKTALGRTIANRYAQKSGRRGGYGQGQPIGIKSDYPGAPVSHGGMEHPFLRPMIDLYGREGVGEADRRVQAKVAEGIASAPNFGAAMHAAQPTARIGYQSGNRDTWPMETLRALRARAESLGVLDQPINTVVQSGMRIHSKLHGDSWNPHGTVAEWINDRVPTHEVERWQAETGAAA